MVRNWGYVCGVDSGSFITEKNEGTVEILRMIFEDDSIEVRSGSFTKNDPGKFFYNGKPGFVWQIFNS